VEFVWAGEGWQCCCGVWEVV